MLGKNAVWTFRQCKIPVINYLFLRIVLDRHFLNERNDKYLVLVVGKKKLSVFCTSWLDSTAILGGCGKERGISSPAWNHCHLSNRQRLWITSTWKWKVSNESQYAERAKVQKPKSPAGHHKQHISGFMSFLDFIFSACFHSIYDSLPN